MRYFLSDHWKKLLVFAIIIIFFFGFFYSMKLTIESTFYEPVNFGLPLKTSSHELSIELDSSYTEKESLFGSFFDEFLGSFLKNKFIYDMASFTTNFEGDKTLILPKNTAYFKSDFISYYGWHKNSKEFLNTVDIDEIETLYVIGDVGFGTRFYSGWDLSIELCYFKLK